MRFVDDNGFKGNRPLGKRALLRGEDYLLFEIQKSRSAKTGDMFVNLKLVSRHRNKAKANYWLAWNITQQKFSQSRDFKLLREHEPFILDWITDALIGMFGAGQAFA